MGMIEAMAGWFRRALLTALVVGAGLAAQPALANVKQAILNVDLKNPGSAVSVIQFSISSPGIGTKLANALINNTQIPITVRSPPGGGGDRFAGAQNTQAGLAVSFIGADIVKVTLTPLKVWAATENVQFIMNVAGTNTVRVVTPRIGLQTIPAFWLDNGNPAKAINKPIKLPGFKGVVKDAEYEQFDDVDPFDVQDLKILPDVTEATFDGLDLDTLMNQPLDNSLLSFSTFPEDLLNLPDPSPGDVFGGEGQILDTDGTVLGSFAEGVEAVPEPASLTVLLVGLGGVFAMRGAQRRRSTR